ncbi:MAG TPA: cutinase family protein [Ktedonobacteraceae bacterium]|nr:cutinase family protein [Ktedonobacteraceae bacterium]
MRSTARHRLRTIFFCLAILASSAISVVLPAATDVYADPACMTNGGVYVVFVRGSGEHFDASEATAFKTQLIGTSNTSGALNRPPLLQIPTAWAEIGNLDGSPGPNDNADDPAEYSAIGYADWGLLPDSAFMGPYYNSVQTGIAELTKHLNDRAARCPKESIVIGGFSQGAEVVGYSLFGVSDYTLSHIGYVALYGDPRNTECSGSTRMSWDRGTAVCATGILGARLPYIPNVLAGRVGSWCDEQDGVCIGNPAYLPIPGNAIATHGSYATRWIADSADEIVYKALTKLNQLNPSSPAVPTPSYTITPPDPNAVPSTSLPPTVSDPPATNLRPATLQYGSEMDVYQAGGDNTIYKDTWNGSSWGGFSSMGGSTTSNPSSVSFNGEMDIFIRGGDGQIYKKTWINNAWSGWNSLGGNMVGSPASIAYGSEMDVFARGQDGLIYKDTWNGSFWSGWNSLGGNMVGNPVAVQYGSEMDVFVQGSDNALWKDTWNGSAWSGWNSLGGVLTGDISALQYGSEMDVFVRGTDGQVWKQTWNGSSWSGWNSLGGNVPGNPVGLAYNGELDVFVRGGDGKIYKQTWNGSAWSGWNSLNGTMTGDPAAVQYNSEMDVFARSSGDGKIYKNTWNGSFWSGWNYLG